MQTSLSVSLPPNSEKARPKKRITTMDLSLDAWCLVFDHLTGDYVTLCNVSLVSRAWRSLSLPYLLKIVDISSHNIEGRLTEHENSVLPIVYSDHHAKYRPENLVPRQRNFLHLLNDRPALARHVKSFTWTLVWSGDNESPLIDIDRETWKIFSRLVNVEQLDLASINDVWEDDIVRKNPSKLFPKVTDLRLLGWMHRCLVKAILGAMDINKLRILKLDWLEDVPLFPDGQLLNAELAVDFAKTRHQYQRDDPEIIIDDDLFRRQEQGEAAIFHGPMWYGMRQLNSQSLGSLASLRISIPQFDLNSDLRNYYTTFNEVAKLIRGASSNLTSLVVILGEDSIFYNVPPSTCGTARIRLRSVHLPWVIKMTAAFLKKILIALSECQYPELTDIVFEGFHLLEDRIAEPDRGGTLPYIENSQFRDVDFTGTRHIDGRLKFEGYDCDVEFYDEEVLRAS